jgi:hypothetical protein
LIQLAENGAIGANPQRQDQDHQPIMTWIVPDLLD